MQVRERPEDVILPAALDDEGLDNAGEDEGERGRHPCVGRLSVVGKKGAGGDEGNRDEETCEELRERRAR